MTVFFTADHHFGHNNIIKYSNRPFRSVEEMDAAMIERWNEVVGLEDIVYYVGDFTLLDNYKAGEYFKHLNGNVFFMNGSHDGWLLSSFELENKSGTMHRIPSLYSLNGLIKSFDGHGLPIVLCHYSMRSWDRSHYGSWHLFGHHHGQLPPYGLSFDIGVDCWDFYPASLEQVKDKMATLEPVVDYSKKHL